MRVRKDNICKLFITIILLMVLTGCEKDDKGKSETGFSYVCVGCERIPWYETKGNSRVLACSENEVFSCEHVFLYKGELVKEEEIENLVEEYDQFEIKTTILKYSIDDKKVLEGIPFGEVDGYVIGASVCENEQLIMTLTSAAEYLGLEEKGWLECWIPVETLSSQASWIKVYAQSIWLGIQKAIYSFFLEMRKT